MCFYLSEHGEIVKSCHVAVEKVTALVIWTIEIIHVKQFDRTRLGAKVACRSSYSICFGTNTVFAVWGSMGI